MGGNQPKPGSPQPIESQRLNTKDLEEAIELTLNFGKKREGDETFKLFGLSMSVFDTAYDMLYANERFREFMDGQTGKAVSKHLIRALDADGDGRITSKDFQIIYENDAKNLLNSHATTLDHLLPFIGQCMFGFTVGLVCGKAAHKLYHQKFLILSTGAAVYTTVQYLAQQNFINQKMLETAFKEKIKELSDINEDGEINEEDLKALLENRMKFITTKLGPGGIAPGMAGYATLGLGVLRGLRRF